MNSAPPIFIVGPTASGKSDTALAIAEKLGGEIISVDSMQVYRGMDIGTAKPSAAERARIPHHLIDVVDVPDPFDAARFVILARKAEQEIRARKHLPIFCGGTGLYFKAFLHGLGDAPPANARIREEIEATPLLDLLRELEQRDPITFARIDRQNPRRVIRAIEVLRLTGQPFSQQRAEWPSLSSGPRPEARIFGLVRTAEDLRTRIEVRVDKMFASGLVDETRVLLRSGLEQNKTAMQAIGYRQVVEHLRGGRSLAETIELVKTKTRQFAKRQLTWFHRQFSVEWIHIKENRAYEPADQIVLLLGDKGGRT